MCNGCVGGKAVSKSFKNSFPILLFTFLEKGGLNQVTGFVLHFFFFLVAKVVGGSYFKVNEYPLLVRASWKTGAAASKTVLLDEILLSQKKGNFI